MLTVTPFVSYSTRFCITRGTGVLLSFFAGVFLSFFAGVLLSVFAGVFLSFFVASFSFFIASFSFFTGVLLSVFTGALLSFFVGALFSFFVASSSFFVSSSSGTPSSGTSSSSSSSSVVASLPSPVPIKGMAMGSLLSEHESSPQAPRTTTIVLSRGAIICAMVTSVCSGTGGIDTMMMLSSFGHTLVCSDCATALSGDVSSVAHPSRKHPLSGKESCSTSRSSPTEKL